MALTISVLDLTTSKRAQLTALPLDGVTLERGQTYTEFPLLGSYPHVQSTAPGISTLTMQLDLWGPQGQNFFIGFLEPAFGYSDGSYQPHVLQVSWGPNAKDAFTGQPLGGLPPTKHELGRDPGEVFARVLELKLITVLNSKPRSVNVQTGKVVAESTLQYVVRDGDDLGRIAARYNTTIQRIAELNGFPVYKPTPGTVLIIPRGP
jgi:LysM repeat protein